ncbi:PREDICTED: uncharacterized protein LOC106103306 isoform X2 [Papilio polytes]|uniref:uncharacterized protein LOC106103306 isoform X2 n=1 Tax=Papilio polytes TaxID=76194 RepID=UPI000675C119|nr:PREDICTED: uncharacterized protein LOC106103306 isoform X2 [Papilio polytes]
MELKSPKAKKKTSKISWKKMFRSPILLLLLLGTSNCDNDVVTSDIDGAVRFDSSNSTNGLRLRHMHLQPANITYNKQILSDIKYLRRHMNREVINFIMTDYLVDGEVEVRVHYNGITAKETSVGINGRGIKLRQLTDGGHLVQIIYTPDGVIQDCEYVADIKTTRNFLKTLRKELKLALEEQTYRIFEKNDNEDERFYRHFGNVTLRLLKGNEKLPPDIANWLDYDRLKMECLERHEELTLIMSNKNKIGEELLTRKKRDAMELLRVPGTKWCGKGFSATHYSQLGGYTRTDRCCRVHDLRCPFWIGGMEKKYGLYNWRVNTLMHCRCDERFRACLKLADTSVSNMVGKLFFNVVQTKCFILKPVKMCTQRSWWGKCLRKGYQKQAFLRDNLPY